jgi:benzoate/toluate 1,2-dioxygenase alpha subunit
MTIANRKKIQAEKDPVKPVDVGAIASGTSTLPGGYFDLGQGHVMLWAEFPSAADRPLHVGGRMSEIEERYGALRAKFMGGFLRNTCIYPNVFVMDQMSTQIRRFHPVAVDKTEVTTYCIAPVGESDAARERRIRQYEDFFNATGMATPDDLEQFRSCQNGFQASEVPWNDLSRGAKHWIDGQDEAAKDIDLFPLLSGAKSEDEGLFVVQHEHWANTLKNIPDEEGRIIYKR